MHRAWRVEDARVRAYGGVEDARERAYGGVEDARERAYGRRELVLILRSAIAKGCGRLERACARLEG
jgi:hypothetical protein